MNDSRSRAETPVGAEEALRKETREFVRWITDGTDPCLTWREGLRCVELIEAANRSKSHGSESGSSYHSTRNWKRIEP